MNNNTLSRLLGLPVPNVDEFDSYVVKRCSELIKKPIDDFSIEDLRLLISQDIGLKIVIPKALEILRTNLFAEGDYYEGDLLKVVLEIPKPYWNENTTQREELKNIIKSDYKITEEQRLTKDIIEKLNHLVLEFTRME